MDYAKALAQGRILLRRLHDTQWEMARLTYQVVQAGKHGIITEWARDLGVSRSLASNYYSVWKEFGERYDGNELGERSFNDCVTEARASHERAERLRREAEESGRGIGTVDRDGRNRDDERERRKDFHRRLREDTEEIRRAIRRDRAIREALRPVFEEEYAPPPAPPPPPVTKPAGRIVQQLIQNLEAVRDRLNRTLIRMIKTKLTRESRAQIDELIEQIENSVDWTRSFMDSGNTSFEEMLQGLVAAEGSPEDEPAEPAEPPPPPRRRVTPKDPVAADASTAPEPSEETVTEPSHRGEKRPPRERDFRVPHKRREKEPSG